VLIIYSMLEMKIVFTYISNVDENVSGHYVVRMWYRTQIRKNSGAIYGLYEMWRIGGSLYVLYMMLELKNVFTELLNVIGVVSGQCSTRGRNVSEKTLTNE
jgi:hypothetical protein